MSAELQLPAVQGTRCLPLLDLVVPAQGKLRRAASLIESQRRSGGTVWVCCALGFSRSAASVMAWLRLHGGAGTLAQAEALVRQAQPQIVLGTAWKQALEQTSEPALP